MRPRPVAPRCGASLLPGAWPYSGRMALIGGLHEWWWCPSCTTEARSSPAAVGPDHHCRGLHGLIVALRPEAERGTAVEHRVNLREDYVAGAEGIPADDQGRPVMSVTTKHGDGQEALIIYAPAAIGRFEGS